MRLLTDGRECCERSDKQEALELAKSTIFRAVLALKEEGLEDISICPETMGKINQLGDLNEVMTLCELDERLLPCIDFGHLNARTFGSIKTVDDYKKILWEIENRLGYARLKEFHSHFSKIEYTSGGEKCHLTFDDTVFGPNFEPLLELVAKKNLCPTFICESAGTQAEDAKKMKDYYLKVK